MTRKGLSMRPLKVNACQQKCHWKRSQVNGEPAQHDGAPLFHCSCCGTEWTRNETWTPREADATVVADIAATRRLGLEDSEYKKLAS